MVYAITKYTKQQLATLNAADLAHAVSLHTERISTKCAKAMLDWRMAPPDQKHAAMMRLDEANKKLDDYIDEQKALFSAKGLSGDRAYKEAIIPTGETNANGVEVYRIVKRETPVTPFDDEVEEVRAEDERLMSEAPKFESDEEWDSFDERLAEEERMLR